LRTKLQAVGLVEPLTVETPKPSISLADFLTGFMNRNGASKKPATRIVCGQVINSLNKCLPKGIELKAVTAGHAKNYLEKLKATTLASTTIHMVFRLPVSSSKMLLTGK